MKLMRMSPLLVVFLVIGSVDARITCSKRNEAMKTCISKGYQPKNKLLGKIFLDNCGIEGISVKKPMKRRDVKKCSKVERLTFKQCGSGCAEKKCPGEMVFDKCVSPCRPSCANPKPLVCKRPCKPTCRCPDHTPILGPDPITGKVRCISVDQCPRCKGGMVYSSCASACPKTCDPQSPVCTRQCVRGCTCPRATPIQHQGQCITPKKCPKEDPCPGDLVMKSCASACPRTCAVPYPMCNKGCVKRCACPMDVSTPDPWKFSSKSPVIFHNGQCIPLDKCPAEHDLCPGGMVLNDCASACLRTCENPEPICTLQCVRRCACPSNAPIFHEGRCIPLKMCPILICPGNMVVQDCPGRCQPTCARPHPICKPPIVCLLGHERSIIRGCACPRDAPILHNGRCIPEEMCPRRCPGDMVFNTCASACPPSCENPGPIKCTKQCARRCDCPRDTPIRASIKGDCISADQCPKVPE